MINATFAVHTTLKYNLQHTINFKCDLSSYMSPLLYEKKGKTKKKKKYVTVKIVVQSFYQLEQSVAEIDRPCF